MNDIGGLGGLPPMSHGHYQRVGGVVKTSQYMMLAEDPQPAAYVPLEQNAAGSMVLVLRTAKRSQVLRMVLRQAMSPVGIVVGGAGALAISRLVAGLLFGLSATDPATFASVVAILLAVALVASAVPAWRASRLDPLLALR